MGTPRRGRNTGREARPHSVTVCNRQLVRREQRYDLGPIGTVLGGCHLFNAKKEQVEKTVAALKEFDIQKLGVSHCTGLKPAFTMTQVFGDRFFFNFR